MALALTYAEKAAGRLTTLSLELVSAAAGLADEVVAVLAGAAGPADLEALGDHGATAVRAVDVPDDRLAAPYAAAALAGELAGAPVAVLLPGTCDGRDVAAALSVAADRPVLANVVALQHDGGVLVAEHSVFGGTVRVQASVTDGGPPILLVRPGAAPATPGRGRTAAGSEVSPALPDGLAAARVLERRAEAVEGPSLEDAPVVVTGGRGLGGPDRFPLVAELARLLGGAPGATRAIVDAGWAPYGLQVGQTGKTVKPECYLAFGVSGATQHVVGMRNARHVVAVNTDEHAPLLALADLAVVGDAPSVLERLVAALRERADGSS